MDSFDPLHGTSVNNHDEATTVLQNSNSGSMDNREGNMDIRDIRDVRDNRGNMDIMDKRERKRTNQKCDVM